MKFSLPFCLFLLSVTALFSACSQSRAVNSGEVVLEEKTENLAGGVVLTDKTEEIQSSQEADTRKPAVEPTLTFADKSELVTMFDGYGNKTETRYFKGHPRLQLVTIRTAAGGMKQVIVYGFGSDVKMMPEEFAEKALTASATEIANAAELKTTRPYKDTFSRTSAPPPPAQTRQMKPVQPTVETTDQNSREETENPSKETENRQSNEENQR